TFAGPDACVRTAAEADYDLAVVAISGRTALPVVMAVLERGKDLALASKEVLAMAGELVTAKAEQKGVRILPLDSEHSA
ncbi:1-deoxy-D-xylulose-5-phosphate reductoisomerase, partial [Bacillus cereus]|nr:1-deoxy-D-xylulose-5-phosphate reductoisomerase [Bacillus cereus]